VSFSAVVLVMMPVSHIYEIMCTLKLAICSFIVTVDEAFGDLTSIHSFKLLSQ
jgi:hypothetical protein